MGAIVPLVKVDRATTVYSHPSISPGLEGHWKFPQKHDLGRGNYLEVSDGL